MSEEELSPIQKLIRLKRYEQPPEDYFEDFLLDFQRRQRAEMLQRPVWQIAWERANLWLEGFRVPAFAYATILVAALGVTGLMMNSQSGTPAANTLAAASTAAASLPSTAPVSGNIATVSTAPHSYVLEKRPVSYDAPFSF
jgi:anti-sigma-K factor RskA